MKINKLLVGTLFGLVGAIPLVAADIKTGPIEYAMLGVAGIIVIGFIVGAFFLIRFIIRKIKNKNVANDINKDSIDKK